jgi:hypothetical protein
MGLGSIYNPNPIQAAGKGDFFFGRRLLGSNVTTKIKDWGSERHLVDAFTKRAYLVELRYAQCKYVVSVKNVEARTESEAAGVANQRAQNARLSLGDLMGYRVLTDSFENRELLGVAGPNDDVIRYENMRAS